MQDQRADDLRRFGVDPAAAAAFLAAEDGEDDTAADDATQAGGAPLVVWPENWRVLRLWLDLENRWLLTPDGHMRALDLCQVDALLRLERPKHPRRLARQLREMERAALEALEEAAP
ncbi:MAG: DUF1799 domain-containing protein [Roseateles sp.]